MRKLSCHPRSDRIRVAECPVLLAKAAVQRTTMDGREVPGILRRPGVEIPDHWHRRLLRPRRQRPRGCRAAEQRDELAPFHQQFLPCFEAEDSTAGDLLHCGISKEPLSAMGPGRVKTSALVASVEHFREIAPYQSQTVLRRYRQIPSRRIVFSTFWGCMSFYTARVIHDRVGPATSPSMSAVPPIPT
jgi:hypothetical protein